MSATKEIPAHGETKIYNQEGMCTIPAEVRHFLELRKGDGVLFFIRPDGTVEVEKKQQD